MILPPATLGVLGGGQLGRYFVIAAQQMGYRVVVLDPDENSVAGRIADTHLVAAYDDEAALTRFAGLCAAVTTEFESVPADSLAFLSDSIPVRPGAGALTISQERGAEKSFLTAHGFPHVPYALIRSEDDIQQADLTLFPAILKVVRFGYDGKGQVRVADRQAALQAFGQLKREKCVLERQMPLDAEVSLVLTRSEQGEVAYFPLAENRHRDGILDYSRVPARQVSSAQAAQAREIAGGIAVGMDYVGTLSVEFFVAAGRLLVNEVAPRPHNSGHFTLDACLSSQFEQQVRALCGLPLGDVTAHCAAVMVNLLGDLWFAGGSKQAREPDWQTLLLVPNLKLHLYGKQDARPGRKMGHFTVLGDDPEKVYDIALACRAAIGAGRSIS
jgi:5-(carboxyamino)imidazole ribonucleotide synthase